LVAQRATGIPLFIEELTRLVLESGGPLAAHEIPPTLNDSLMARLDRLGTAKEVCQIAAVIGREFPYKLLAAVATVPEAELRSDLAKLADAGLIYVRGEPPQSTYQFKHALIQDAAYDALLKSRRRELHGTVAHAMVERFVELAESQPAIVARHWTDAGRHELAIPAWQKVGDATRARQAFKEAEEAYRQAVAILEKQPESSERDARELKLRSALGEVIQITKGYSSPEAIEANRRARMLAETSGNLAQIVLDLLGTWIAITVTSADHSAANEVADRMLDLAEREGSAATRGYAHEVKLCNCYYRGDLVGCEKYFARGRQFFDAPTFRNFRGAVAHTFGFAAYNAGTLGRAGVARERLQHTLTVARENHSPYDLAFALQQQSNLRLLLREPELAEAAAAEAVTLSEEHGFPYFGFTSRIALGWARAQLGRVQEGIGLIRHGLVEMARSGMRNFIPRYLTYLAAAQARDGALADAFDSLAQALEANPQELLYRPETVRLRGELQLSRGEIEQAQAGFLEAIALAEGMSAKGWELRATMSLARLLAQRQRSAEARAMLAEVYNWFTEGFDTPDLKDAKTLLDELSG
jgi:tetratricopeptide (TPR) repeat protein